jgi:hypothetical protein
MRPVLVRTFLSMAETRPIARLTVPDSLIQDVA